MKPEELQQKISEYYEKLSPELQEAFSNMEWLEKINEIGKKYSLKDTELESLGIETTLVLLGILHIEEYEKNLGLEIKISKEEFIKMMAEIDEQIMKPVKLELTKTFHKNSKELVNNKHGGQQKIDQRLNSLPEKLQEAIQQSNYQVKIYEIGQKYNLSIEDLGILEETATKTILGTINPSNFEKELKAKIKLEETKLNDFVDEINTSIFENIRDSLKNQWEKDKTSADNKIENSNNEIPLPPYGKVESSKEQVVGGGGKKDIKDEEEIPLPNYSNEKPKDSEVLLRHGIEMIEEKTPNSHTNYREPIDEPGVDFISQKLNKPTASENVVKDYSLPKMTTSKETPNKDAYREKI